MGGGISVDEMSPRARFLRSLERCLSSSDFIPSFYTTFLSYSDEIRDKFRHTNFDHQYKMLEQSLRLASDAAIGLPDGLRELTERAETHSRRHLNIAPHFYEMWLSALIITACKFDAQWDNEIENSWRMVLGHVIHHMIIRY